MKLKQVDKSNARRIMATNMRQVLLNTLLPYTERPWMEKLTIKSNAARAVNHLLPSWKPAVLEIIIKRVPPLVFESLFKWSKFPNTVTDCLRKVVKWIHILRQRVWENESSGTESLIRRQIVRRNYSIGTISPDKATDCLRKLLKRNVFSVKLFWEN